jgi:phage baseplate assembly protein V
MIDAVTRLLAPLRNRIANMVARAVVQLVADGGSLQALQLVVGADETRDGCERFQEYGFTSVPLAGAEAVVLFVGGRRDHGLVVAVDDRRHRMAGLEAGEVALYTDEGDHVLLSRGRVVTITAGTKIVLDAPDVEWAHPATDAALKGTAYVSALGTFLGALSTYAGAIKAIADPSNAATPTLTGAITAFGTAAAAALSAKVKVG